MSAPHLCSYPRRAVSVPPPVAVAMTAESPPTPARPPRIDLAGFLAGWFRAWQAGRLYGAGHPVVRDAATQAAAALQGLRGPRSVVVLPDGFECSGVEVQSDTAAEALRALSTALHGLDIGSIELAPGLTADDAEAAALALAEASERPVVERVNSAAPGRLSLRAVTYRGVQVRDAALGGHGDAGADPHSRARLWSRLNTGILDPSSEATDPRLLAQQIGAEVVARPRVALAGLRESLVGAARALADRPQDEQRRGMERMRTLLSGLGPQLRTSLERVAAAHPHTPQDSDARPANDAMAAEITGALARGESAGAGLSSEALMLCQKLADLRQDGPDDAGGDENPAEALAGALESLFSRFDPTEFTPDDYRDQIRGTMDAAGPAAPRPGVERAFAAETLGVRCAHIAHDLLDADAGQPSAALQEVIAASVVPLIDAREFGVLSDRLRCGDAVLVLALARDAVIDRVLVADTLDHAGDDHAVITGLLNHAGDRAIDRITHRVVAGPDAEGDAPRTGPAAERLLASATAMVRLGALQRALAETAGPLPRGAAPLLTGLPFNAATDLLKTRLNAPQMPERHAAYALLAAAFPDWPARFLSQALRDRDPGVQRCVLDRLSAGSDARHLALAKLALEGQSAAGVLPAEAFDRLTRGTLDRGIEGLWVAARVQRTLASALTPRRAALGVRLARQLAEHRDNPPVRRALLLWRLMPARWVARLAGPPAAVSVAPKAPAAAPATAPASQPRSAA